MSLNDITNFIQLTEDLLTSGQPDENDFHELADAGVEVVINLATGTSDLTLPNEPELVQGLGMEHIHIPVNWDNPTTENLEKFFAEMDAHRGQKVLVHCALNYRVSCFTALWKVLRLGEEPKQAFSHLFEIWEPKEYPAWDDFIRRALQAAGFEMPSV